MDNKPAFVDTNLILQVVCGSVAHGLATADSDVDTRGVCIPPANYLLGLRTFEQHESADGNHVVFALSKFARLALAGNPNIIEILYVEAQHRKVVTSWGQRLLDHRDLFLSRRVGERFSRYAVDQLKRMQRHRRWLVDPPGGPPQPEYFGAQPSGGRQVFPSSDAQRAFRAALKHWNHYLAWRQGRNPRRATLEQRHGYDTKHAMHLARLLRMGAEILRDGAVHVLRPDADWLRGVREGAMTYDDLIAWAAEEERRLPDLVAASPLPIEPDEEAAETLVMELQQGFLFQRD